MRKGGWAGVPLQSWRWDWVIRFEGVEVYHWLSCLHGLLSVVDRQCFLVLEARIMDEFGEGSLEEEKFVICWGWGHRIKRDHSRCPATELGILLMGLELENKEEMLGVAVSLPVFSACRFGVSRNKQIFNKQNRRKSPRQKYQLYQVAVVLQKVIEKYQNTPWLYC